MKKYEVNIKEITYYQTIEIDAKNEEDAKTKAIEQIEQGMGFATDGEYKLNSIRKKLK